MAQLANIVLKDNADADVTFTPDRIDQGVASLVNSTGVPIGNKAISLSSTKTTAGRRKVTLKLVLPVVQDAEVNGVTRPTIVRTSYVDIAFSFDGSSSSLERDDALSFAHSLLANAGIIEKMVKDLEGVY